MLITPLVVNNMAFLPFRVGITQSNMSTPREMHSRIFQGVPTPIRYLGFSDGRLSQQRPHISYISNSGSPTLKPPIAFPLAFFDETYSHDSFLKSANVLPCTMGKRF